MYFNIDGILTSNADPNQSGPGSNGNREVSSFPECSRTGASPLDAA